VVLAIAGAAVFMLGVKLPADRKANREKAAVAAAENFYQALAKADAATALGLLYATPRSTQLLTDEVLATSTTAAPITDVSITFVPPASATRDGEPATAQPTGTDTVQVEVSYSLGGTAVVHPLTMRTHDGAWKVVGGTATLDLTEGWVCNPGTSHQTSCTATSGPGLEVNGQTVDNPELVVLFPGSYTVTTRSAHLVVGENAFTITDPAKIHVVAGITVALDEAGVESFRAAVRDSLDACLEVMVYSTECGMTVPRFVGTSSEVTDGTIRRTMTPEAETWRTTARPWLTDMGTARAAAPEGGVTVFVSGTRNGRPVEGAIVEADGSKTVYSIRAPQVTWDGSGKPAVSWR